MTVYLPKASWPNPGREAPATRRARVRQSVKLSPAHACDTGLGLAWVLQCDPYAHAWVMPNDVLHAVRGLNSSTRGLSARDSLPSEGLVAQPRKGGTCHATRTRAQLIKLRFHRRDLSFHFLFRC